MRYQSADSLRRAIDDRLANQARATGQPVDRLRRRLAFERMLVRLDHSRQGWRLKGGMALEVRWIDRARTTRDMDLEAAGLRDAETVKRRLAAALLADPDGDRFGFEAGSPSPIGGEEVGGDGWRVPVRAVLAGRTFSEIRVDLIEAADIGIDADRLPLPGSMAFAEISAGECDAIPLEQHWAEKLHAMTRLYGAGIPSSRVRDLVDMVLMVEAEAVDPVKTRSVATRVFAARATHPLPDRLPDPPGSWEPTYRALADEIDLRATDIGAGLNLVRAFWATGDSR